MNPFHEGKASDAVIRHIEGRDGGTRQDLRSPEQEGDPAPVELTCFIGGRCFAFEHTGIDPFEGQIDIETHGHFRPSARLVLRTGTSKTNSTSYAYRSVPNCLKSR